MKERTYICCALNRAEEQEIPICAKTLKQILM